MGNRLAHAVVHATVFPKSFLASDFFPYSRTFLQSPFSMILVCLLRRLVVLAVHFPARLEVALPPPLRTLQVACSGVLKDLPGVLRIRQRVEGCVNFLRGSFRIFSFFSPILFSSHGLAQLELLLKSPIRILNHPCTQVPIPRVHNGFIFYPSTLFPLTHFSPSRRSSQVGPTPLPRTPFVA